MKLHPLSSYSNENPPWKDPEWVYQPSYETNIQERINNCLVKLIKKKDKN